MAQRYSAPNFKHPQARSTRIFWTIADNYALWRCEDSQGCLSTTHVCHFDRLVLKTYLKQHRHYKQATDGFHLPLLSLPVGSQRLYLRSRRCRLIIYNHVNSACIYTVWIKLFAYPTIGQVWSVSRNVVGYKATIASSLTLVGFSIIGGIDCNGTILQW